MEGIDPDLLAAYGELVNELPELVHPDQIPAFREWGTTRLEPGDTLARRFGFDYSLRDLGGDELASQFTPRRSHGVARIAFVHGGGLVAGSPLDGVASALWVARSIGASVVSLPYPLAPEAPFRAQIACVTHSLRRLLDEGEQPLFLMGQSAGGALAASCAFDEDLTALAGILLLGPMLRPPRPGDSPPTVEDGAWTSRANATAWRAALAGDSGSTRWLASERLIASSHVAGLPPWLVDVGSRELFRDEVTEWVARLGQAGASVEFHLWAGAFHGFDVAAPQARVSRAAREVRATWAARILRENRDGARVLGKDALWA